MDNNQLYSGLHAPARFALRKVQSLGKPFGKLLAAAFIIICASFDASALNLSWDVGSAGANTGATIITGSGNWDTSTLNWNTGAGDVAWTQTSTTSPLNNAIFGGEDGTYFITNVVQVAATNITINNSGYTFSGSPIYLSSSGLLSVAAGKAATFNCNFASGNNPEDYWGGSGAVLNFTGNFGGQQPHYAGPTNCAYYLGGINTPSVLWVLAPVNETNGSLTTTASFFIGYPAVVNGTNYTSGSLTISGGATATQNGGNLTVGRGGGTGTLTLLNGTVNVGASGSTARDLQMTADGSGAEHGTINVYGGTINVGEVGSPTVNGPIEISPGGSVAGETAILDQTNGVINAWGGIQIGASTGTYSGGSGMYTNSGGSLYLGPNGLVLGTVHPPTNNITLSGGLVGALGNWSTVMPITLATLNGNITFQCSDANNDSYNITLAGPLTGPGGLNMTGGGTLTLSGTNTYAGSTMMSNGTLVIITGPASTANGPVVVDGSTGNGSPVVTLQVSKPGQSWSIGSLAFTAGNPILNYQFGSLSPSTSVAPVLAGGNVVFTATPTINVTGAAIAEGTYPLITYTGIVSGTPPGNVNITLTGGSAAGYITNLTATGTIALVVTSSTYNPALYWSGGDNSWDINTTADWLQFGGPVKYTDGDAVVFADSNNGTSPFVVTLNTAVAPISVTGANTLDNYIITGTGGINGSGFLSLLGGGTVTLATTNTYYGGTTIGGGSQLNINNGGNPNATAVGTGPLTINASSIIDDTSGTNVTLEAPVPEIWNGSFTYAGSANFNTGSGGVTLNNNAMLTVEANSLAVGGSINDNGSNFKLTKTGNGTLALPVGNYFGGGLELVSGLVDLGDPNAVGQGLFTIDGGSIDNVSGQPLTLQAGSYAWESSFTFVGTTNLDLGSGDVSVGAALTVNVVSNVFETDADILSGNSVVTKAGAGDWILGGYASGANNLQMIVSAGEVDLAKQSGYAIGLGGFGLTVESNALVLDIYGNQLYHGGGVVDPVVLNNGILDLNGQTETLEQLLITNNGVLRNGASGSTAILAITTANTAALGEILLGGTNCQFDVATVDATMNIYGPIAGSGSLVMTGLGVLNLETNNPYTGSTVIGNGTIALPGAGSMSNTADIYLATTNAALDLSENQYTDGNGNPVLTLQRGQTLSGFGTVTGLVATAGSATVAPGSPSAAGVLTVTGFSNDTNVLDGVTLMKLNQGSLTNDELVVQQGSLAFGGTLALTNLSGALAVGNTFILFSAPGGFSGAFVGIVPSRPGYPAFGLAWNTNNLAVNGTISVIAGSVPPSPKIASLALSGTTLSLSGNGGQPGALFAVLESTNLTAALSNWVPVSTNAFDESGNFDISLSVTNGPQAFFTLMLQ